MSLYCDCTGRGVLSVRYSVTVETVQLLCGVCWWVGPELSAIPAGASKTLLLICHVVRSFFKFSVVFYFLIRRLLLVLFFVSLGFCSSVCRGTKYSKASVVIDSLWK